VNYTDQDGDDEISRDIGSKMSDVFGIVNYLKLV